MGNGVTQCEWCHASEAHGGFWEILKKSVELRPASGEDGWFSLTPETFVAGATCVCVWGGGRWKSQNRKIVPLSPYVKEPLNSKIIKGFVPELRSCYVFFEFRDSYVLSLSYIYIYIYIYMNSICPFRIFMYMAMVQCDGFIYLDSQPKKSGMGWPHGSSEGYLNSIKT